MKSVKSIIQVLKISAKYGAYVFVIVDIINYAIERIEKEFNTQENDSK